MSNGAKMSIRERHGRGTNFERSINALRVMRNVQALKYLEQDVVNTKLRLKRRRITLNEISSEVHLADLYVKEHDIHSRCQQEIEKMRNEYESRVKDAEKRYQEQIAEQQTLLKETVERVKRSETEAKLLADREREHYEKEAEYRLFIEAGSLRDEYEKLHKECEALKKEQEQSRRNKAKIADLKTEIEARQKPPSKPQQRIVMAKEKRKRLKEVLH